MSRYIIVTGFILFSVLLISHPALGEVEQIHGSVMVSVENVPVMFGKVFIEEEQYVVETDENGLFTLFLEPGTYTLTISHPSFFPRQVEYIVSQNSSLPELTILLNRPQIVEKIFVSAQNNADLFSSSQIARYKIDEMNTRDIGEFLRSEPGINGIKKGGAFIDPVLRGFKTDQINVQIDGGSHVTGACPNRMDPPTSHIQSEDLEAIEIIRGPHTVRFGPVFGGLINLVTPVPQQTEDFSITGTVLGGYESSSDGKRSRLSLSGALKPFDFYLGGGIKDYGNYTDGDGETVQSSFEMRDYLIKLGTNISESQRIQFTARQSFMRDALYPALPMDADEDNTTMVAFDHRKNFESQVLESSRFKLYYSTVEHIMSNARKGTAAMMDAVTDADTVHAGGRYEISLSIGQGTVYSGLDYSDMTIDGTRTRDVKMGEMAGRHFEDIIWPDAEIEDFGLFAELDYSITDLFTVLFGSRVDWVKSDAGNPDPSYQEIYGADLARDDVNTALSAGVAYEVTDDSTLSLSFGRSVRSPNVTERYIFLLPVGKDNFDYLGNPELQPEENRQLELRYNGSYKTLYWDSSMYYSSINDYISASVNEEITSRSPGVEGVKVFKNIEEATLYGGEVRAGIYVGERMNFFGGISYVRGEDEGRNEPLAEIAPFESSLGARYTSPEKLYWTQVSGRFVNSQDRVSGSFAEKKSPGFSILDIRGNLRLGQSFSLNAGISNLLDTAYYEHLNRLEKTTGEPIFEQGRNVYLTLNYTF